MNLISEALKKAIKETLNLPAILSPQKAEITTGHIVLEFFDNVPNSNNDTATFWAWYVTGGTHKRWLGKAMEAKRKLRLVEDTFMPLELEDENSTRLRAYWKRSGSPAWVYSENEDGGMPAYYRAPYIVTVDYPSGLQTETED